MTAALLRKPEPTFPILVATLRAALFPAVAMVLSACSTTTPAAGVTTATFVVVRHAEKESDARDPALSSLGLERAERLAARLARETLVAAYATGYRRTRQTAKPAADAHGIAVTVYDAQLPANEFASQLRATHKRGTVLVVGHSNTVPEIVSALSGTAVEAMTEQQFDRIYVVGIGADGKARLVQDSY